MDFLGMGNGELGAPSGDKGQWGMGNRSPILSIPRIKNHFTFRSNSKKTDCDSGGCGMWY